MAYGTYPGSRGTPRLLSTAAGGTALSTTRAFIAIPAGIRHLRLDPRNFSTAVVAKVALNPHLVVLKTNDAMATDPTDYSENAQDGDVATLVTLSDMPTLANGGALYIGADDLFAGLQIDVVSADGGAGAIAVHYWDGNSWETITPTDNTSNMGSDGSITWTVPTDWAKGFLSDILSTYRKGTTRELFWVRISTATAYDASTTLASIYPINRRNDAVQELVAGLPFETEIDRAKNGGSIHVVTDAGTANLIVTGYS